MNSGPTPHARLAFNPWFLEEFPIGLGALVRQDTSVRVATVCFMAAGWPEPRYTIECFPVILAFAALLGVPGDWPLGGESAATGTEFAGG